MFVLPPHSQTSQKQKKEGEMMEFYEVIPRVVGYGFLICVLFFFVIMPIAASLTDPKAKKDKERRRRIRKQKELEAAQPYWCNLERFVQECHRRNISRPYRGSSGFCYVCGRSHDHTTSDGNPKNGYRCTHCQNEIFQIVCQHNDLPDSEKRYVWLREDLERMVALDLSDGVITMEQAEEDYRHINDLIAEKREFDAGADEREQQRVAAIKQREQSISDTIANSRRNISRRI